MLLIFHRPCPTHSFINVHRPDPGQTEETAGHAVAWREVSHRGPGSCVSRHAAGVQPQSALCAAAGLPEGGGGV